MNNITENTKTFDVFEVTYPTLFVPTSGIKIAMLGKNWQKECIDNIISNGSNYDVTVYVDDLSTPDTYDWLTMSLKNSDMIIMHIGDKNLSPYETFMAGILMSMDNAIITCTITNQKLDYIRALGFNLKGSVIDTCEPQYKVFEFLEAVERL